MRLLVAVAVLCSGAAHADVTSQPVDLLDGRVSIDVPAPVVKTVFVSPGEEQVLGPLIEIRP